MRRDDGFTLVELLVGISLMAIIGSVVVTSIVRSLDVTGQATERVEQLTALQQAQERMSRTIRAADPINSATATSLQVITYTEVAGCTPVRSDACTERRRTTFTRAGETITRTQDVFLPASSSTALSTSTIVVIDDLDPDVEEVFTYLDEMGGEVDGSTPSEIREVEITLRHANQDGPPVVLSTGVFVRNTAASA